MVPRHLEGSEKKLPFVVLIDTSEPDNGHEGDELTAHGGCGTVALLLGRGSRCIHGTGRLPTEKEYAS
jgi:hypothetical protein